MRRVRWWAGIGAAALLLALAAWAGAEGGGIKVEPGKWEFRTRSNQPMGDPQEQLTTQCLSEDEMKPDIFRKDAKGCSFSETKTSATEMSWRMSCAQEGRTLTGDARFTSTGDAVEGVLKMAFLFDDQRVDFERTWRGKRLGPCD